MKNSQQEGQPSSERSSEVRLESAVVIIQHQCLFDDIGLCASTTTVLNRFFFSNGKFSLGEKDFKCLKSYKSINLCNKWIFLIEY